MNVRNVFSVGLAAALALGWSAAEAKTLAVKTVCQADFQKLCPNATDNRGAVGRCVKVRLDKVSPDCKAAVQAAQAKNAARRAARKAARAASAQTPKTATAG